MALDYVSVTIAFICLPLLTMFLRYVTKMIFGKIGVGPPGNLLLVANSKPAGEPRIPQSVNYHFTRQCNYKCGFCFHTARTSFVLPIKEAKRGLEMLKMAGKLQWQRAEVYVSFSVLMSFTELIIIYQLLYFPTYVHLCELNGIGKQITIIVICLPVEWIWIK